MTGTPPEGLCIDSLSNGDRRGVYLLHRAAYAAGLRDGETVDEGIIRDKAIATIDRVGMRSCRSLVAKIDEVDRT